MVVRDSSSLTVPFYTHDCPEVETNCSTYVTEKPCSDPTDCGRALEVYYANLATKGSRWWFCPKLHDILWTCLKPLRTGQTPLSNFYLHDKPQEHHRDYKEASLAFLHLPKCGGTSINDLVYRLAGGQRNVHDIRHCAEFYKLSYDMGIGEKRLFMISKRVYGLHQFANPKRPFLYFAWFRDPVDRVVSQYYFLQTFPNVHSHLIRNKNLTEFLRDTEGKHHHVFDNFMVRLLQFGNHHELDDSFEMRDGAVEPGNTEAPEVTIKHFLTAKKNLINDIGFIGLLEDFKTSQDMFCFMTKSKCPDEAIHRNKNSKRPTDSLTDYEYKEIVKRNVWDIKLYELATNIYEQQKETYLAMEK
ncbi:uncharacterized protein LOC144355608 [Saccoglossus kowalevskii]